MRRRDVIQGLAGSLALTPSIALTQPSLPLIGFIHSGSRPRYVPRVEAFHQSLSAGGFTEGKTVALEYRWAEGDYARIPVLAAELVSRGVNVILAAGGVVAPVVKAATSTIPIVFITGADPVAQGLVKSFSRPGGNATGVSFMTFELGPKRLGLLRDLAPAAAEIAVLINEKNRDAFLFKRELEQGYHNIGSGVRILTAGNASEIEAAFARLVKEPSNALLVHADPVYTNSIPLITALAGAIGIPTIYPSRDFVIAGGLMSYGADIKEEYRQAGAYVARILKGEKPSELPVVQPTRFELVINLKKATELKIDIPPVLLAQATEVFE